MFAKLTTSRDGIQRADLRVSHRLTVREMATLVHAAELEDERPHVLRAAAVERTIRRKMGEVGSNHLPFLDEDHGEEWNEARVTVLAAWIQDYVIQR